MNTECVTRQLVLLGTGTSTGVPIIGCDCAVCTSTNPRNQRTRTGALIRTAEGNFLIDTPPELRMQLLREKVDLIHAAVFTHAHADHIHGLDDLRVFGHRLDRAVPLYCEENVEQQLRAAFNYAFAPPSPNAHAFAVPRLRFERIRSAVPANQTGNAGGLEPFELLGVVVRPIRLLHGELPVLGFRIADVAFCTDVSQIPDESWPLLEGLDVLVIDALRERPHPTHFSVGQSLQIVERVKPRQTYFTHIAHQLDHDATNARLPAGVEMAYDGLKIPF